jgi:type I restriction enzyme, S subunit
VSWNYVEAGELMAKRGGAVDPSKFPDEVFELHSIPAFDAGRPEIVPGREIGSAKQLVRADDVMISKIVPHIRRASVVGAFTGHRQIGSGEWIVFRDSRFFPAYLRHFLMSDDFNGKFMATVSGVGGSLLRARPAEVAKIKIPLPPMEEQRRIAAILDKADALRAKRREAISKLDQLLQSAFIEIFGDAVNNPKGWPLVALSEVAGKIGSGSTPRGGDSAYEKDGTSFIRSLNIHDGEFRHKNLAHINHEQAKKLDGVTIFSGDILLNITGASVARVCQVPDDVLPARVSQHVSIIRPKSMLDSVFLESCLMSFSIKRVLLGISGSGATREAITKSQLENLIIPLPPIVKQKEYSSVVSRIRGQLKKQRASLNVLEAFLSSFSQSAFSGRS